VEREPRSTDPDMEGWRPSVARHQGEDHVIGFIVFGLVVGFLARAVVPGRQRLSLGTTLVLGLVGSVVGGLVANALGTGDILELNFVGSIVAIGAAVVLIVVGDRMGAITNRGRR
jgi:uncharacterized membrane protein YeaQ/YmgE (transglycosylase-associated protein family)